MAFCGTICMISGMAAQGKQYKMWYKIRLKLEPFCECGCGLLGAAVWNPGVCGRITPGASHSSLTRAHART